MPYNFPDTPIEGETFTPPGGPTYTWHTPAWELNADLNDGDKGDIVISGNGTVMMIDETVITPAAKTVLDETTTAGMLTALGGIGEAPMDGQFWARRNGAWEVIDVSGGGGGGDGVMGTIINTGVFFAPEVR